MTQLFPTSTPIAAPAGASLLPSIAPQGESSEAFIASGIPIPADSGFAATLLAKLQTDAAAPPHIDQASFSPDNLAATAELPGPSTQAHTPDFSVIAAETILVSPPSVFSPGLPGSDGSLLATAAFDGQKPGTLPAAESPPVFSPPGTQEGTSGGVEIPRPWFNAVVLDASAEPASLPTAATITPAEGIEIFEIASGDQLQPLQESSGLERQSVQAESRQLSSAAAVSRDLSEVVVTLANPIQLPESSAPASADVNVATIRAESAVAESVEAPVVEGFKPAATLTPASPTHVLSAGVTQPEYLVQRTTPEIADKVTPGHSDSEQLDKSQLSRHAEPLDKRDVEILSADRYTAAVRSVEEPHEELSVQSPTQEHAGAERVEAASDQAAIASGGTAREESFATPSSFETTDTGPSSNSGTDNVSVSASADRSGSQYQGQRELLDSVSVSETVLAVPESNPKTIDRPSSPEPRQAPPLFPEPVATDSPSTAFASPVPVSLGADQGATAEPAHSAAPVIDREVAPGSLVTTANKQASLPETVEAESNSLQLPDTVALAAESFPSNGEAIPSTDAEIHVASQHFDPVEQTTSTPIASQVIPPGEPVTAPLGETEESSEPELRSTTSEEQATDLADSPEFKPEMTNSDVREAINGNSSETLPQPTQPVRLFLPPLNVAGSEQTVEFLTSPNSGEATLTGITQEFPVLNQQVTANGIEAAAAEHQEAPSSGRVRATAPVVAQLAAKSQFESGPDFERVQIQLDPPELGRVMLDVVRSEEGLSARIVANEPAAKAVLELELPALRRSLGDAGVELANVDVSQGDSGFAGSREDARSFRTQIPTLRLRSLNSDNTATSSVSEVNYAHASDQEHVDILA